MRLHTIQGYIQQMYLVEYPDKLLLLDGASRADVAYLKHYITHEMQRPLSDLKVVVVTHMHPDHAGGAHLLRKICGAKIIAANQPGHWYQGLAGWLMFITDLALARWVANRMRKPRRRLWYARKLKPDVMLNDGDTLPEFSDWQVLETPGHTDRDLSLYHQGDSILYVADLIVSVKDKLISPFPVFYPNRYRESVTRVYQLQAEHLLIAHGGEVNFDLPAYRHLMDTAPITPATHWRATKIKFRALIRSILLFGWTEKKPSR
ncbi:MBL fold metallo-hydrolase [Vibrio sp.]|uniref:MBL fold metallo-hydrolase n=1 Tax=Vibrio sp. TaxID=678 RepID=UPI003D0EFC2E